MRRQDREILAWDEIEEIINQCKVCRVAFRDDEEIYIVPMNFGYKKEDENLSFYFHGAKKGKKAELMEKSACKVGFEMDCEHGLKIGETACQYGYKYASLIGQGTIEIVQAIDEQKEGLDLLMKHQTHECFEFNEAMLQSVYVYKLTTKHYSAKRCR